MWQKKLEKSLEKIRIYEKKTLSLYIDKKPGNMNRHEIKNEKIFKYDSFVEYNLGLHLLKEKNTKVLYRGPANECTLDIDVITRNTVKWLIIKK